MPNGDQEIGVCVHETMTCEWVCPKTFAIQGWKMGFPDGEIQLLDMLKAGEDYDAMVFTKDAYDKFVFPAQVIAHGYAQAARMRTRHHACLAKAYVVVHQLDCTWTCVPAKTKRHHYVQWSSNTVAARKPGLSQTYDAIVLTPEAYERFALPFQVTDKGAARAYATYTVYLSRVRTRHALEKRP